MKSLIAAAAVLLPSGGLAFAGFQRRMCQECGELIHRHFQL